MPPAQDFRPTDRRKLARVAFALAALLPATASAQELGLDLTSESPAEQGELGLDLSDLSSGPDFRPTLALLPLSAADEDGSAPSVADRARAAKLEAALVGSAMKSGWFSRLLSPARVRELLGERAGALLSCSAQDCFGQLTDALDVERVAVARVTFTRAGPRLRLVGHVRGATELREGAVDASAGRGPLFEKRAAAAWRPLLEQLSGPLAQLEVKTADGARVAIDGRPVGTGSLEKLVAAGRHRVRVSADGFSTFERDVDFAPRATVKLEATLIPATGDAPSLALEPAPLVETPAATTSASLWKKPGLYVAGAGVAALAVGLAFGASAKSLEGRGGDGDGDGIRDITRAEMQSAQRNATLANVLLGVGAAAITGGTAWMLLEPSSATPRHGRGDEPEEQAAATTWTLVAGGVF